jgi:hypothetical protein
VPYSFGRVRTSSQARVTNASSGSGTSCCRWTLHIKEVVETKRGRAREFGLGVESLLKEANQLWKDHRAGKVHTEAFAQEGKRIDAALTHQLRIRRLIDPDNQRLLDGIGLQHDRGSVVRFLFNPAIEPTNNRAERALRPAVIARRVSQCSKNQRGAEAFAPFSTVIRTMVKKATTSIADPTPSTTAAKLVGTKKRSVTSTATASSAAGTPT